METKQLNNFQIEFFDEEEVVKMSLELWKNRILKSNYNRDSNNNCFVEYVGLVSGISEESAEKIVDNELYEDDFNTYTSIGTKVLLYPDYTNDKFSYETAKQSFQTLSDLEYCVITKTK